MEPNCITIVGIDQFIVELGGHIVSGWSEDSDALMMPEALELITTRRGADGQLIGSFTKRSRRPGHIQAPVELGIDGIFHAGRSQHVGEPTLSHLLVGRGA